MRKCDQARYWRSASYRYERYMGWRYLSIPALCIHPILSIPCIQHSLRSLVAFSPRKFWDRTVVANDYSLTASLFHQRNYYFIQASLQW